MDGIRARFSSVGERGEATALPSKMLSAETSSGEGRGVGTARGSLERAGRHLDGWLPFGPDAETIGKCWREVQEIASNDGRIPQELTCAAYLTVSIDENLEKAQEGLDEYLQRYYGASTDLLKSMMACFAGPLEEAGRWVQDYVGVGASHIILRFTGDNEKHLDMFMKLRADLNW